MIHFFLFAISIMPFNSLAQEIKIDVQLSPVGSFQIKSKSLTGKAIMKGDSLIAKNIVLDLTKLESGIELRDKHIQDHFETKQFPKAVLTKALGKGGKFIGDLQLRGQKLRIQGTYIKKGSNAKATFVVKGSDFKMKSANYMGVGVEDEVTVHVEMPLSAGK